MGIKFVQRSCATVSAVSIGTIKLSFRNNKFLLYKDVYLAPNFGKKKLLCIARVFEQGFILNCNNVL